MKTPFIAKITIILSLMASSLFAVVPEVTALQILERGNYGSVGNYSNGCLVITFNTDVVVGTANKNIKICSVVTTAAGQVRNSTTSVVKFGEAGLAANQVAIYFHLWVPGQEYYITADAAAFKDSGSADLSAAINTSGSITVTCPASPGLETLNTNVASSDYLNKEVDGWLPRGGFAYTYRNISTNTNIIFEKKSDANGTYYNLYTWGSAGDCQNFYRSGDSGLVGGGMMYREVTNDEVEIIGMWYGDEGASATKYQLQDGHLSSDLEYHVSSSVAMTAYWLMGFMRTDDISKIGYYQNPDRYYQPELLALGRGGYNNNNNNSARFYWFDERNKWNHGGSVGLPNGGAGNNQPDPVNNPYKFRLVYHRISDATNPYPDRVSIYYSNTLKTGWVPLTFADLGDSYGDKPVWTNFMMWDGGEGWKTLTNIPIGFFYKDSTTYPYAGARNSSNKLLAFTSFAGSSSEMFWIRHSIKIEYRVPGMGFVTPTPSAGGNVYNSLDFALRVEYTNTNEFFNSAHLWLYYNGATGTPNAVYNFSTSASIFSNTFALPDYHTLPPGANNLRAVAILSNHGVTNVIERNFTIVQSPFVENVRITNYANSTPTNVFNGFLVQEDCYTNYVLVDVKNLTHLVLITNAPSTGAGTGVVGVSNVSGDGTKVVVWITGAPTGNHGNAPDYKLQIVGSNNTLGISYIITNTPVDVKSRGQVQLFALKNIAGPISDLNATIAPVVSVKTVTSIQFFVKSNVGGDEDFTGISALSTWTNSSAASSNDYTLSPTWTYPIDGAYDMKVWAGDGNLADWKYYSNVTVDRYSATFGSIPTTITNKSTSYAVPVVTRNVNKIELYYKAEGESDSNYVLHTYKNITAGATDTNTLDWVMPNLDKQYRLRVVCYNYSTTNSPLTPVVGVETNDSSAILLSRYDNPVAAVTWTWDDHYVFGIDSPAWEPGRDFTLNFTNVTSVKFLTNIGTNATNTNVTAWDTASLVVKEETVTSPGSATYTWYPPLNTNVGNYYGTYAGYYTLRFVAYNVIGEAVTNERRFQINPSVHTTSHYGGWSNTYSCNDTAYDYVNRVASSDGASYSPMSNSGGGIYYDTTSNVMHIYGYGHMDGFYFNGKDRGMTWISSWGIHFMGNYVYRLAPTNYTIIGRIDQIMLDRASTFLGSWREKLAVQLFVRRPPDTGGTFDMRNMEQDIGVYAGYATPMYREAFNGEVDFVIHMKTNRKYEYDSGSGYIGDVSTGAKSTVTNHLPGYYNISESMAGNPLRKQTNDIKVWVRLTYTYPSVEVYFSEATTTGEPGQWTMATNVIFSTNFGTNSGHLTNAQGLTAYGVRVQSVSADRWARASIGSLMLMQPGTLNFASPPTPVANSACSNNLNISLVVSATNIRSNTLLVYTNLNRVAEGNNLDLTENYNNSVLSYGNYLIEPPIALATASGTYTKEIDVSGMKEGTTFSLVAICDNYLSTIIELTNIVVDNYPSPVLVTPSISSGLLLRSTNLVSNSPFVWKNTLTFSVTNGKSVVLTATNKTTGHFETIFSMSNLSDGTYTYDWYMGTNWEGFVETTFSAVNVVNETTNVKFTNVYVDNATNGFVGRDSAYAWENTSHGYQVNGIWVSNFTITNSVANAVFVSFAVSNKYGVQTISVMSNYTNSPSLATTNTLAFTWDFAGSVTNDGVNSFIVTVYNAFGEPFVTNYTNIVINNVANPGFVYIPMLDVDYTNDFWQRELTNWKTNYVFTHSNGVYAELLTNNAVRLSTSGTALNPSNTNILVSLEWHMLPAEDTITSISNVTNVSVSLRITNIAGEEAIASVNKVWIDNVVDPLIYFLNLPTNNTVDGADKYWLTRHTLRTNIFIQQSNSFGLWMEHSIHWGTNTNTILTLSTDPDGSGPSLASRVLSTSTNWLWDLSDVFANEGLHTLSLKTTNNVPGASPITVNSFVWVDNLYPPDIVFTNFRGGVLNGHSAKVGESFNIFVHIFNEYGTVSISNVRFSTNDYGLSNVFATSVIPVAPNVYGASFTMPNLPLGENKIYAVVEDSVFQTNIAALTIYRVISDNDLDYDPSGSPIVADNDRSQERMFTYVFNPKVKGHLSNFYLVGGYGGGGFTNHGTNIAPLSETRYSVTFDFFNMPSGKYQLWVQDKYSGWQEYRREDGFVVVRNSYDNETDIVGSRVFSAVSGEVQEIAMIANPLGLSQKAEVKVYDVSGRYIATPLSETETTSEVQYIVTWDGKDHSGNDVRSGVYVVVLKVVTETEAETIRKVIVVPRR